MSKKFHPMFEKWQIKRLPGTYYSRAYNQRFSDLVTWLNHKQPGQPYQNLESKAHQMLSEVGNWHGT
jgi:hypothetical protein